MTAILAMPSTNGVVVVADRRTYRRVASVAYEVLDERDKLHLVDSGVAALSANGLGLFLRDVIPAMEARGLSVARDPAAATAWLQNRFRSYVQEIITFAPDRALPELFGASLLFVSRHGIHVIDQGCSPQGEGIEFSFLTWSQDCRHSALAGVGTGMALAQAIDRDEAAHPEFAADHSYRAHILDRRGGLVDAATAQAFLLRYLADAVAHMPEISPDAVGTVGGTFDVGIVDRNGFHYVERSVDLPAAIHA